MAYKSKEGLFSFGDVTRRIIIDPSKPALIQEERGILEIPGTGLTQTAKGYELLGVPLPDHAMADSQVRKNLPRSRKRKSKRPDTICLETGDNNKKLQSDQLTPIEETQSDQIPAIEKPPLVLKGRENMDPNDPRGGRAQAVIDELLRIHHKTGARVLYESERSIEERLKERQLLVIETKDGNKRVFDFPSSFAGSRSFIKLVRKGFDLVGNETVSFLKKAMNAGPHQIIELVADFQQKVNIREAQIVAERQEKKAKRKTNGKSKK